MAGRFLTQTQMRFIRYLTIVENAVHKRNVKRQAKRGRRAHWPDQTGSDKKTQAVIASRHSVCGGQHVEARPITRRGIRQRGKFEG